MYFPAQSMILALTNDSKSILIKSFLACLFWVLVTNPAFSQGLKETNNEFTFAIIGDSQFNKPETFNRIIEQVAMLNPTLVIQVGDLISGKVKDKKENRAQWERFRGQISPLGDIPYYPVPGNHDVLDKEGKPSAAPFFQEQWGSLYYSFNYKNAHFTIVNTSDSIEANIAALQMNWLTLDLKQHENKEHKFVFFHHPIYLLKNEDKLHELFLRYGVTAVFYGHLHHYEYQERDGIPYVMTNATGKTSIEVPEAGNFHHFLFATVRDDKFSFAIIEDKGVIDPKSIKPDDNRLYFLNRNIFPENPVKAESLVKNGNTYEFSLTLNNPTKQDVTAFIQWEIPNQRWKILPSLGASAALKAGEKDHQIPFQFERVDDSEIEVWPVCVVKIPFLTSSGKWVDTEYVLTIAPD